MFRTCSAAVKYILPGATSQMEIYRMKAGPVNPNKPLEVQRIRLQNIDYYIYEPLLHCLLTDDNMNKTQFYIMLHPLKTDSAYIVEKIYDVFHLIMHLEKLEKSE